MVIKVELSDALARREMLERLPDAAINRLDTLQLEHQRAEKMIDCRRRGLDDNIVNNKRYFYASFALFFRSCLSGYKLSSLSYLLGEGEGGGYCFP